jgi:hypothetical protein
VRPMLRNREHIEARALAALKPVDAATGVQLDDALRVRALDGRATFVRNRRGLLALTHWSTLASHRDAFETPPTTTGIGSETLRVAIEDPLGRYLPRIASIALPRDPDPANASDPDSLFVPIEIPMFPASHSPTGANWSLLRVSLREQTSGDALGGALIRVLRGGDVIARGLTDGRGEALVAVIGVPVMTFGADEDDTVIVSTISVSLEAIFDPASGTRIAASALREGADPPAPLVDPFDLENRMNQFETDIRALQIAARRSLSVAMTLELP